MTELSGEQRKLQTWQADRAVSNTQNIHFDIDFDFNVDLDDERLTQGAPYLSCGAIPLSQHWLHSCWGRRLSGSGGGCRQAGGNCANCAWRWLREKITYIIVIIPAGKERTAITLSDCPLNTKTLFKVAWLSLTCNYNSLRASTCIHSPSRALNHPHQKKKKHTSQK